jgi:hypothetical protein
VTEKIQFKFFAPHEKSEWACYMFGSTPGSNGLVYYPNKNSVPNWFVRWMMKVCLGCTWMKGDWK